MSEAYLAGGDAYEDIHHIHKPGQTFRPLQDHTLNFLDLTIKVGDTRGAVFPRIYYADAYHEPFGPILSAGSIAMSQVTFMPRDWPFFEPWGKSIYENYPWIFLPLGTSLTVSIENGIATITNPGNEDCGIFFRPLINLPLVNPSDNKPLRVAFDNPEVTEESTSTQIMLELLLEKNTEKFTIYLCIGCGAEWEWRKPQHAEQLPTLTYGWLFTGPGYHDLDLYQLFIKFRTELGLSTDPTDWHINQLGFALGTQSPSAIDYLKSDYLGFYHDTAPQVGKNLATTGKTQNGKTYRFRCKMTPYLLAKGEYYALLLDAPPIPYPVRDAWLYDKGDATYPRGLRLLTEDGGITWTKHYNDDHLFAEWGDPPLPKPEPPPPISYQAILDITYYPTMDGILISLPTNVPCHLFCYWTDKKPGKHHSSRTIRGKTVPWGTYFCFVGWHAVEQNEPGDTLYHTFTLEPWPECETRWFTFRGNIANELSPSVGPIFEKHHPGITPHQKYESYEVHGWDYSFIHEPYRTGQTFTPTKGHTLTKVYTLMARVPRTYPNLYLEIREAPNDIPTAPILSSGRTIWAVIPERPYPAWVETPMSTCILKPNVKYAIIARTAHVGAGDLCWYADRWYGTYPRGIRIRSNDAGNTWSKFPVDDALFQEWGITFKGE